MQTTRFGAMNSRFASGLMLLLLPLAACRKNNTPDPLPPRAQIMKDFPRIPAATLLDTAGTPEAERWTHIVVLPFDSSKKFFRDTLPRLGWTIGAGNENQARETLDMYAQKGRQNVWIQLHGQLWEFGIRRTMYTVIAAEGGSHDSSSAPVRPIQVPNRPAAGARP